MVQDKNCPFHRVLFKSYGGEEMRREKRHEDALAVSMASNNRYEDENLVMMEDFGNHSVHSNSNASYGVLKNEDVQGDWEGRLPAGIVEVTTSDSLPQPPREMRFSYSFRKHRSNLRSGRINSRLIEPRNSLESCLMAQLYKEHAEIEEYTYSVHPLPKPSVGTFLLTDGSRLISRAPHDCISEQTRKKHKLPKEAHSQENKTVLGVPRLPDVVPLELQNKGKARKEKGEILGTESCKMTKANHHKMQGSSSGTLLFLFGVSMGIISSFLANIQEMEKLNKLLKQSENLVQDLQEELEMKDSLTVKELTVEDFGFQDMHNDQYHDDAMHASLLEQESGGSSRYCNDECCDLKAEEESFSKIEAELEAELEILESTMNSSRLEGLRSTISELDPGLALDVVEGDLRADMFGVETGNRPYADRDGSGSSSPLSVHYAVSPRELSLRLHEVIQSRLEERVKELETALQNSQRKVKYIQYEHGMSPRRKVSDSKTGTASSTHDSSPIAGDARQSLDQPVIINLSEEALALYNESYKEFAKVSESDEEDLQYEFENCEWFRDGCMRQESVSDENPEMVFDRRTEEDLCTTSNDQIVSSSRDESEDEAEKLLIRQIVQKAKLGAPAVLKSTLTLN